MSRSGALRLAAEPLTAAGFAPFGQVIEPDPERSYPINDGTCLRFHDLARLALNAAGGRACLSIFRARPATPPVSVRLMERHPLSSQAFVPLAARRFLVVVAPPGEPPVAAELKAFLATGGQGVNYDPGVWHHPLLALDAECDFLVVDRAGPGDNCDEWHPAPADAVVIGI